MMLIPYHTGGQEYEEIQDLAVTADGDGTGFSVDFDALLEINPDTIAWIRFEEPSIIKLSGGKRVRTIMSISQRHLRRTTINWVQSSWI